MSDDDESPDDVVCSCCVKRDALRPGSPSTEDTLGEGGVPRTLIVTWAFIDARIPLVAEKLSPESRARFLAMPYAKQAKIVVMLSRLGALD